MVTGMPLLAWAIIQTNWISSLSWNSSTRRWVTGRGGSSPLVIFSAQSRMTSYKSTTRLRLSISLYAAMNGGISDSSGSMAHLKFSNSLKAVSLSISVLVTAIARLRKVFCSGGVAILPSILCRRRWSIESL